MEEAEDETAALDGAKQREFTKFKLIKNNSEVIDYSKVEKRPQILAALAVAYGICINGTSFGWSSSFQTQLLIQNENTTLSNNDLINSTTYSWELQLSKDEMSWAGSLVTFGALMGSLIGGPLMDKFGRKITLMVMFIPFTIGWVLVSLSLNSGMIYGGRIICGLAGGITSVAVPCYNSEISTPNMRGVVGMFFSLWIGVGYFIASLLVWLEWRLATGLMAIQSVLYLTALYFVPESPYFLAKRGRLGSARVALIWLRGSAYNVEAELSQIRNRIHMDQSLSFRWSDLFRPWAYKPILIGIAIIMLFQFSGLNAAIFNTVPIFKLTGATIEPELCAVIVTAALVVVSIFSSSILVRKLGRKTLHATCEIIASISWFALGGYFYLFDNDPETAANLGWLPLTCLITFMAAAGAGIAPLAWVVSSEVLPARLRGPGSSIAAFTSWISAFIVTKSYLDIQRSLTTAGVFWIYGGFCFLGFIFSAFILPETKGKTPDEIQAIFEPKKRSADV